MEKTLCDLLVTADRIWTGTDAPVIEGPAGVVVKDGKIMDVGSVKALTKVWKPAVRRNLGKAMLMPGLVNAHTHVPMTFLRGFADDLPLLEWLQKRIFPIEEKLTNKVVALGARLGMFEMIRTGTTSFVDSYLHESNVLKEADKLGMRCMGGEAVFADNWEAAEAWYREEAAKWADNGRIQVAMMPHSVYTTSDDVLRNSMRLAEELDLMVQMHLSESVTEVEECACKHQGRRPIAYARDMGMLSPRTSLAHMVDVRDDEFAVILESGATVVHNPVSNLKLASGFARVRDMLACGTPVALGTDGACSNNSLDMFETMKLSALLAKGFTGDATTVPAEQALKMATVEGARIFRTSGLGTLAAGAPADVIALDLNQPNLCPLYNEASHAVYAAFGKDCCFTMVDGKILYDKSRYTENVLFAETIAEMQDVVDWVKKQA